MHLVTFEPPDAARAGDARAQRTLPSMGDAALGFDALDSPHFGARRLGAVLAPVAQDPVVVDLNRAFAVKLAADDGGAPEAEADSLLPPDMRAFLARLPESLDAAQEALLFVTDAMARYDAPDVRRAGVVLPRRTVRLCAPVLRPGKFLSAGSADPARASARGAGARGAPALFLKAPSAVIGPDDEIVLPRAATRAEVAGGIVAVIGARARDLSPGDALRCVAGYCVGAEVSVRDADGAAGRGALTTSRDTFAPLGPSLVTADEVSDPQDLAIRATLSGDLLQSGHTKEMAWSVAEIVATASRWMSLEPGDLVFAGAPGAAEDRPPRFLRDGDVVEVEVEKLGRLVSYVREARRP